MSEAKATEFKKYMIVSSEEIHEYDLEVTERGPYLTEYALRYSTGSQWSDHVKGETALQAIDNGNGLKIIFSEVDEINREDCETETLEELHVDYATLQYLSILIRSIEALNSEHHEKFKIIPISEGIQL